VSGLAPMSTIWAPWIAVSGRRSTAFRTARGIAFENEMCCALRLIRSC
jgi:hypothetical protein